MPDNNFLLLIIAGIIALVVLHMTSNNAPMKVKKSEPKVVASVVSPLSSPSTASSSASSESSSESSASPASSAESSPKSASSPVAATSAAVKEKFSYSESSQSSSGVELEGMDNVEGFQNASPNATPKLLPKAESVLKSAVLGNTFGGGNFSTKLVGASGSVGPNTTNVNGLALDNAAIDYTLGVTPIISKEKKEKKLTAKDLLPKESKDDWFDMPYDKKQMYRIENENLLAGASTQSKIGIDTQGQTLKNASHDLRAAPPNPKFNVGPWNVSTIEPDYNIKPIM